LIKNKVNDNLTGEILEEIYLGLDQKTISIFKERYEKNRAISFKEE